MVDVLKCKKMVDVLHATTVDVFNATRVDVLHAVDNAKKRFMY